MLCYEDTGRINYCPYKNQKEILMPPKKAGLIKEKKSTKTQNKINKDKNIKRLLDYDSQKPKKKKRQSLKLKWFKKKQQTANMTMTMIMMMTVTLMMMMMIKGLD
jgi:hypothetical protein